EDRLSEAVLRNEFRVFDRMFEIEAEVPEITPALTTAIQGMEGVIGIEATENLLVAYCSQDLKHDIEEAIKENGGLVASIKAQSYVSKALIDVEEHEIVLKTKEELIPDLAAAGALLGNGKA
ncbi:hypothetical protein ACFLTL_01770, partial [Chloroflexota bacterium]